MKKIILKGKRITLRPVELSDAAIFVPWFSDPVVTKYLNRYQGGKKPFTLAEEKKWIRNIIQGKEQPVWSIINEMGRVIGNTTIRIKPEPLIANFGIVIGDKTEWGKGYAVEVLELLLEYAFVKLKLNRFELTADAKNKRAIRAYIKAGFKIEGRLREDFYNKVTKKFGDRYMMSVLRREWIKKK